MASDQHWNIEKINETVSSKNLNNFNTLFTNNYIDLVYSAFTKLEFHKANFKKNNNTIHDVESEVLFSLSNIDKDLFKEAYKIMSNQHDKVNYFVKHLKENILFKNNKNICSDYRENDVLKKVVYITFENDVTDYPTIMHEVAHAFSFERGNLLFSEIESIFTEKLVVEDLLKRGVIGTSDFDEYNKNRLNALKERLIFVIGENEILNNLPFPISEKQILYFLKRYENSPKLNFIIFTFKALSTDLIDGNSDIHLRYLIAEIVSSYLLDSYKKDKDNTMEKFKYFLKNQNEFNDIEYLSYYFSNMSFKELTYKILNEFNKEKNSIKR